MHICCKGNVELKLLYYFLRGINLPSDLYGRHSKYLEELLVPELDISLQQEIVKQIDNQLLIGSIAFAEDDVENGITSPDYVVLKGKNGVVNSRWFYYWLRSPLGQQCINSLARGAVRERMLFNRLAEGSIDLPDFPIQEKAAEALGNLKMMQTHFKIQLQDLIKLTSKILAQAFNQIEND